MRRIRVCGLVRVEQRINVDQVRAGAPGGDEVEDDVAVRVEPAAVADVPVVVGDGDRVVELGPANTLEVDLERTTGLHDLRRLDDAPLDEVRDLRPQVGPLKDADEVPTTEAVGDGERRLQRPVRGGRAAAERLGDE